MSKLKKQKQYQSSIIDEIYDQITPLEFEMANIRMRVATRIWDLVQEKGWDKRTFAELMERDPEEISYWLSGTMNFDIKLLTEISFKTGIDIAEFFMEDFHKQINIGSLNNLAIVKQNNYNPFDSESIGKKQYQAHG